MNKTPITNIKKDIFVCLNKIKITVLRKMIKYNSRAPSFKKLPKRFRKFLNPIIAIFENRYNSVEIAKIIIATMSRDISNVSKFLSLEI